jgi:hypothetical protein
MDQEIKPIKWRNAIQCTVCDEIIESKHRHDFKWCGCGSCAVDGGTAYLRRLGNPGDWIELSNFDENEKK